MLSVPESSGWFISMTEVWWRNAACTGVVMSRFAALHALAEDAESSWAWELFILAFRCEAWCMYHFVKKRDYSGSIHE